VLIANTKILKFIFSNISK